MSVLKIFEYFSITFIHIMCIFFQKILESFTSIYLKTYSLQDYWHHILYLIIFGYILFSDFITIVYCCLYYCRPITLINDFIINDLSYLLN